MLYFWIKFIHVLATAVWFGVNLLQAGDIRMSLELGKPHTDTLGTRIGRIHVISMISGFLTILTGFIMIFVVGGFGNVPGRIHAGLGLTILLYALEYLLVIGSWKKIAAVLNAGGDSMAALPFAKRYAMGIGIGHLLRTVIFALMILQF